MYKDENGKWHHTQEELEKMRAANQGELNPRYGKPGTFTGKHHNSETKDRLKSTNQGKHITFSPERNAKIGEANRRRSRDVYKAAGEKGSKTRKAQWAELTPEERREKSRPILEARTRKHEWYAELDEERKQAWRKSISSGVHAFYDAMTAEDYAEYVYQVTESGHRAVFEKHTSKPEKLFGDALTAYGIVYTKSKAPIRVNGRSYWPDFMLSDMDIVEFNGCYTHQCELCGHNKGYYAKQKRRHISAEEKRMYDAQRVADLESLGYTVKVVWEHQLRSKEGYGEVIKSIKETGIKREEA